MSIIFENDVNCNMSKNEVSNIERELFKEEIINVYDNIECPGNNENKSLCENKVRGEKFGSFEIKENKSLCENNDDFVDSDNKSLCDNNADFVDSESKSLCENNVDFVDSESKSLGENNDDFVDSENKCLCEVQCEIIEGFGIKNIKSLSENKVRGEHSKSFRVNETSLCEKNYYNVIEEDKNFGNVSHKNEICMCLKFRTFIVNEKTKICDLH